MSHDVSLITINKEALCLKLSISARGLENMIQRREQVKPTTPP